VGAVVHAHPRVCTTDCRRSERTHQSNVPFGATGSSKTERNINLVSEFDIPVGKWRTHGVVTCHTYHLHYYWTQKKDLFSAVGLLTVIWSCFALQEIDKPESVCGLHKFLHQGVTRIRKIRLRPFLLQILKITVHTPTGNSVLTAELNITRLTLNQTTFRNSAHTSQRTYFYSII
jgi:hypothetical protein